MISNRFRIACDIAVLLARKKRQTTGALSTALRVSVSYIERIVRELRTGGIISGQRGPGGGYKMARDPSACTAQDVALCLDSASHESVIDRSVAGFLRTVTIADMARGVA